MKRASLLTPTFAAFVAVILATLPSGSAQQGFEQQPPPPQPINEQMRILLRGPVHEAFAEPYQPNPEAGFTAPQAPPPDIREVPPDVRPTGFAELQWIPGYWGWDEKSFVWISGIWRDPPPEMRWVPGYWARVGDALRWVSGFWLRADMSEIAYLPQPPPSREQGPIGNPPDANRFWVPGVWLFQNGDFAWRDGFWAPAHEQFVWVPAQYSWTPRGFVFIDGYWDYPPEGRGVLFAPVYPENANVAYTPSVMIEAPSALAHFFVRPSYCHYYFGDYYDVPAQRRGFYSWVGYQTYDPLRTFLRFARPTVYQTIVTQHTWFEKNRDRRPPHTWRDYGTYIRNFSDHSAPGVAIAASVHDKNAAARFVRVPQDVHGRHAGASQFYQQLTGQRQQLEKAKAEHRVADKLRLPEAIAPDRAAKDHGKREPAPVTHGRLPAPPIHLAPSARPDRRDDGRREEFRPNPKGKEPDPRKRDAREPKKDKDGPRKKKDSG